MHAGAATVCEATRTHCIFASTGVLIVARRERALESLGVPSSALVVTLAVAVDVAAVFALGVAHRADEGRCGLVDLFLREGAANGPDFRVHRALRAVGVVICQSCFARIQGGRGALEEGGRGRGKKVHVTRILRYTYERIAAAVVVDVAAVRALRVLGRANLGAGGASEGG